MQMEILLVLRKYYVVFPTDILVSQSPLLAKIFFNVSSFWMFSNLILSPIVNKLSYPFLHFFFTLFHIFTLFYIFFHFLPLLTIFTQLYPIAQLHIIAHIRTLCEFSPSYRINLGSSPSILLAINHKALQTCMNIINFMWSLRTSKTLFSSAKIHINFLLKGK